MPPLYSTSFSISDPSVMRFASRVAYFLWAGPSTEIHVVSVNRCYMSFFEDERGVESFVAQHMHNIPRVIEGTLRERVGEVKWVIRTPGVVRLEGLTWPSDEALREREWRNARVWGIEKEEWEGEWLV
jgi:hypothetical protein